jgi:hypothetical protein
MHHIIQKGEHERMITTLGCMLEAIECNYMNRQTFDMLIQFAFLTDETKKQIYEYREHPQRTKESSELNTEAVS